MTLTLEQVVPAFLFSLLLGVMLGVLYEPIRIFHMLGFTKKYHYYITDFLFMTASAVITYLYCLSFLDGSIRFFVILGELTGFMVFHLVITPLTGKIYRPIIKICKKIFAKLLKIIRRIMYNGIKMYRKLFARISVFLSKGRCYVRKEKYSKKRKHSHKRIKHRKA